MDIVDLQPAVTVVRAERQRLSARQIAYLRTYPALLDLAASRTGNARNDFLRLACAVYGWMPRVLRIDSNRLEDAVAAVGAARQATGANVSLADVGAVAACLYSVVGASKLLHFVNPSVYPIWDSKVQRNWRRSATDNAEPSQSYMSNPQNYVDYAQEVHRMPEKPGFDRFIGEFKQAHEERLTRLEIDVYDIGNVRAVEAAAFELSGGEYEEA